MKIKVTVISPLNSSRMRLIEWADRQKLYVSFCAPMRIDRRFGVAASSIFAVLHSDDLPEIEREAMRECFVVRQVLGDLVSVNRD